LIATIRELTPIEYEEALERDIEPP